jgi:ankyrin repeat protein
LINSKKKFYLSKKQSKKHLNKWFYQLDNYKTMQHQQQHQKQMPLDKTNLEALELVLELKREQNIPITEIADQDGNSLMHKSIIYNQYEVTRYLIVNYPSLLGLKNCFGFYPIHLCVVKGSMQMLRLVCRESKKYINKRDNSGLTPAMLAAIEGKYEILKYLLGKFFFLLIFYLFSVKLIIK